MAAVLEAPHAFENIDDASAELILQLQLLELEDLKAKKAGKQKEGHSDDSEIAAALFEQDLEALLISLSDRRMTKSIADAVQTDGVLLARTMLEEETACEDHTMAHRLNGSDVTSEVHLQPDSIDDTMLSKLVGRFVSEDLGHALAAGFDYENEENDEDQEPESSAWAGLNKRRQNSGALNRQCEACREPKKYFDLIAAPCRHEYCRDCIRDLFDASFTDESLFPPRCCRTAIPMKEVGIFLTKELKQKFEEKKVEFGTPNRTYCCHPTCSVFIANDNIIDDTAVCPECLTQTCTVCKSEAHAGVDCPNDTALQGVLDLADENGWQRCYACRRMVELEVGCNHISCRCGAQFCYICSLPWKTCTCNQWDEHRLLARANLVVQRDVPRMAEDNPIRIGRVQEAAEMLRERHNCTHRQWRYISGSHECEECHFELPHYIFECRQCRIQACNRCRRNRL